MHPFEKSGLGTPPFRVRACISYPDRGLLQSNRDAYNAAVREAYDTAKHFGVKPGTCEHCGMCLMHSYVITSADGHNHVVGSTCVGKTGDSPLLNDVMIIQKKRADQKKVAKKLDKIAARKAKAKVDRRGVYKLHEVLAHQMWETRRNLFIRSILRFALSTGRVTDGQVKAVERWFEKSSEHMARCEAHAKLVETSKFAGTIGQRLNLKVTVDRVIHGNGFMPWTLTLLKDEFGNALTTFGVCRIERDKPTLIKATVKVHKFHEGIKQTTINWIKVLG